MNQPHVALVQDGSRGHYGLALALHEAGILDVMFTDFFIQSGSMWDHLSPLMRRGPAPLRRMADRRADALRTVRVRANLHRRLWQHWRRRGFAREVDYFRWQAADTGRWIARSLNPPINILMGFNRNLDPGLCRKAQQRGIRTVGDQMIAPAVEEKREMALQHERFPGWETPRLEEFDTLIEIEAATWSALDAVTCPSDYVARHLGAVGVPAERIHVINYPIDESHFAFVERAGRGGPVRVGFVGQINLRKGVPYFVEVAKRFPRHRATFTLVGHSQLTPTAMAEVRKHVEVVSAVRSEVPAQLASFDLIYFPSTCEGSAYALMEAMSSGLPIVTSPNSGTVARHGMEGFLCPYDDLDGAAAYIERLVADSDLRLAMGRAAHDRYLQFNLAHYRGQTESLCRRLLNPSN